MSTKVLQIDSDVTCFNDLLCPRVCVCFQSSSANEFMPLKRCGKWLKASGFYCLSQFSFLNFWQPQFLCALSLSLFVLLFYFVFCCLSPSLFPFNSFSPVFPCFSFSCLFDPMKSFLLTTIIYTNCSKLHVHLPRLLLWWFRSAVLPLIRIMRVFSHLVRLLHEFSKITTYSVVSCI